MKQDIVIIDYGVGNSHSVANALGFLGYHFSVSSDPDDLRSARFLILPGVGAFPEAMKNLALRHLVGPLNEEVLGRKKPILGICLGMQVLASESEEFGLHQGLGWIEGRVVRFKNKAGFPLPHVGWNNLKITRKDPLFSRVGENPNFYFDHSFHFVCGDQYATAKCDYGTEFVASVRKGNIFGTQFHPEKSQGNGLKLFRSLIESVKTYAA